MVTIGVVGSQLYREVDKDIENLIAGCRKCRDTTTLFHSMSSIDPINPVFPYDCKEQKEIISDKIRGAYSNGISLESSEKRLSVWIARQCSRCEYNKS